MARQGIDMKLENEKPHKVTYLELTPDEILEGDHSWLRKQPGHEEAGLTKKEDDDKFDE
jgi:hypothetical protein